MPVNPSMGFVGPAPFHFHMQRSGQQWPNYLLAKHDTGRHGTQPLRRGLVPARNSLVLDESLATQLFQVVSSLARPVRWIYSACLLFGLDLEEQQRSRFQYEYKTYQLEFSRNLRFK